MALTMTDVLRLAACAPKKGGWNALDDRLISYLYYFNIEQDYFECHEYAEHLWFALQRPVVLKGLIQAAVCLYHLNNGNVRGGYSMWQRAKRYMEAACPVYQGIDLAKLIRDIDETYSLVPQAWYTKRVSPREIAQLRLPTVKIQIVDEEILALLPNWKPTPLEKD
ncbi:DUF309 domain-containing protein [Alicyclobacillus fodiniaquatilis]|uniref:DUF309 domain-containing protein n=1 Tax=Alicyclobacillus fodiniaquatilis TaxID=1661150 RepID=A0ABW4JGF2_9BACL